MQGVDGANFEGIDMKTGKSKIICYEWSAGE